MQCLRCSDGVVVIAGGVDEAVGRVLAGGWHAKRIPSIPSIL